MIEIVMSFVLGFLIASLAALMMLPVLNRRAARLARRRIDGLFPVSMQEIAAERDALRAEFAVSQRRLERKADAALAARQDGMRAVGAKLMEVATLQRDVEARDTALVARRAEIDEALARISGLDRDLSSARSDGAAGLAALTALEEAHREILADLKTTRRERDAVRGDLTSALDRAEIAAAAPSPAQIEEISGLHSSLDDLKGRHDALAGERDTIAASLKVAEDALDQALAGRREPGPQPREEADDDLRRRISEVADLLVRQDRLPSTADFPLPLGRAS